MFRFLSEGYGANIYLTFEPAPSQPMTRSKFIEFKIGESATHANKVSLITPASFEIGIVGLPFSANTIREILLANKLSTSGKIYINEEGLIKMEFIENEITSTYFLVRLSE